MDTFQSLVAELTNRIEEIKKLEKEALSSTYWDWQNKYSRLEGKREGLEEILNFIRRFK